MRTFLDDQGTEWTVWAVRPSRSRFSGAVHPIGPDGTPAAPPRAADGPAPRAERRWRADRRREPAPDPIVERRRGGDRRAVASRAARSTMPSTLADGWLAFQAGTVRRRLAPIPTHWESCTDRELAQLCRAAEPAPPAQTTIRRADDTPRHDR